MHRLCCVRPEGSAAAATSSQGVWHQHRSLRANSKGRERLWLGRSQMRCLTYLLSPLWFALVQHPQRLAEPAAGTPLSSGYLCWDRKQKSGWACGVGCCYSCFFGIIRTIPLKSQLPMNLSILIWISGAGIPAGHPNLLPGQRILFMLMAQRILWQVLHSVRKWTDLLFASRRRVFFLFLSIQFIVVCSFYSLKLSQGREPRKYSTLGWGARRGE